MLQLNLRKMDVHLEICSNLHLTVLLNELLLHY